MPTDAEVRLIVAHEVNRILNPRWVVVSLGLMLALMLAVFHVWNTTETNRAFITAQQKLLGELSAQHSIAEVMKHQTDLLAAIAAAVGADTGSNPEEEK